MQAAEHFVLCAVHVRLWRDKADQISYQRCQIGLHREQAAQLPAFTSLIVSSS
jgi:hypothetical protein